MSSRLAGRGLPGVHTSLKASSVRAAMPASSTPSKDASGKATDQGAASTDPSATGASSASASAGQAQTAPGSAAGAGTYRFRFVMGDKDLTEDRVFVVG